MATAPIAHFSDFTGASSLTGSEGLASLQGGKNVLITPSQLLGFVSVQPATLSNKTVATPAAGDNSGAIANTGWVTAAIAPLAPKASPAFTGTAMFAGASFSGAVALASRPSFNGAMPWDSANFTPSSYLTVANPTFTGTLTSAAGQIQIGGTLDATTSQPSGFGVRIRSSASGSAILQFTDSQAQAQWGALSTTSAGQLGWNGSTVWHSGNLNPAAYLPLSGGQISGPIGIGATGYQVGQNVAAGYYADATNLAVRLGQGAGAILFFQTYGGLSNLAAFSAQVCNFLAPLTQNGNQVWHAGNFSPANYATLNNPVFSGLVQPQMSGTPTIANGTPGQQGGLRISQPSPSQGASYLEFLNTNRFGAFLGLDTDNQFKVGGWSFGATSYVLLHSGNFSTYAFPSSGGTLGGSLTATGQVSGSAFGADGQLRAVYGGTVASFRNDGASVYLLKNAGAASGYDGHRPLTVNLSTGVVTIDGTGAGTILGGSLTAQGNGSFNDVTIRSDRRLKVVDGPINDATDIIQQTRAYAGMKGGRRGFFLLAQEAREVTPCLVHEGEGPYRGGEPLLSLDLLSYVPILLEEVKRLRLEIEALKAAA